MPEIGIEQLSVELAEFVRNRFFGKYRGLVQDVDDPDGLGRVVVRVPEVYGEVDSPWALPAVPFAGQGHGLVLLPEVNDGVWVEFEAGDISRPIWTGCWWARNELPDPGGTGVRALVTSAGHQVVLDEDSDELKLVHPGGAEVTLSSSEITLQIGGSEIVLSSSEITLKSGSGQIALSASGVSINNGALEVS